MLIDPQDLFADVVAERVVKALAPALKQLLESAEIRNDAADLKERLDAWTEWGDKAVALVNPADPNDPGAVWGTQEVRKFIGLAIEELVLLRRLEEAIRDTTRPDLDALDAFRKDNDP